MPEEIAILGASVLFKALIYNGKHESSMIGMNKYVFCLGDMCVSWKIQCVSDWTNSNDAAFTGVLLSRW